jgi:hypothetical protein
MYPEGSWYVRYVLVLCCVSTLTVWSPLLTMCAISCKNKKFGLPTKRTIIRIKADYCPKCINKDVFIMAMECVKCETRTEFLHKFKCKSVFETLKSIGLECFTTNYHSLQCLIFFMISRRWLWTSFFHTDGVALRPWELMNRLDKRKIRTAEIKIPWPLKRLKKEGDKFSVSVFYIS